MRPIKIQSLIASRALPFLVVPLIFFVIYQLIAVFQKTLSTDTTIAELQKQASDLEESTRRLQALNDFLNSDFFAEKEARMRLGMQKAGEKVVVVQENGLFDPKTGTHEQQEAGGKSIGDLAKTHPELWWAYFFGT
ncbi:septum formation initiator family protein [Candidatus Uhrbacteria bacterium]|nr:septum formation initiator family protein [Candidatus Uhrbacteria bacterium]